MKFQLIALGIAVLLFHQRLILVICFGVTCATAYCVFRALKTLPRHCVPAFLIGTLVPRFLFSDVIFVILLFWKNGAMSCEPLGISNMTTDYLQSAAAECIKIGLHHTTRSGLGARMQTGLVESLLLTLAVAVVHWLGELAISKLINAFSGDVRARINLILVTSQRHGHTNGGVLHLTRALLNGEAWLGRIELFFMLVVQMICVASLSVGGILALSLINGVTLYAWFQLVIMELLARLKMFAINFPNNAELVYHNTVFEYAFPAITNCTIGIGEKLPEMTFQCEWSKDANVLRGVNYFIVTLAAFGAFVFALRAFIRPIWELLLKNTSLSLDQTEEDEGLRWRDDVKRSTPWHYYYFINELPEDQRRKILQVLNVAFTPQNTPQAQQAEDALRAIEMLQQNLAIL